MGSRSVNLSTMCGEMRIISFICQHKVMRKILEHLQIYEDKKQRAPPLKKKLIKEVELEPFDDGWPAYEELAFDR